MKLLLAWMLMALSVGPAFCSNYVIDTGADMRRFLLVADRALRDEKLSEDENMLLVYGSSYFRGYVDGIEAVGRKGNGSEFIVPEGVTYADLNKIVLKYLNAHPDQLDMNATVLIYSALADAFPNPNFK